MELNLKKTTAALVALGMVGVANAAAYEPEPAPTCNPNVNLPCVYEGWSFAVDYLWVQPTSDGLQYAHIDPVNTASPLDTNFRAPGINPGFNSSALRLEAGYYWDTGSFAKLDWTHLFDRNVGREARRSLSGTTGIGNGILTNLGTYDTRFPGTGVSPETTGILGVGSFEHDEVNLVFGQTVLFGPRLVVNKFFGLQYARVDVSLETHAIGTEDNTVASPTLGLRGPISAETSKFNGIGFVAGMDAEYDLNFWDLSLVGGGQASLLAGQVKLESQIAEQTGTAGSETAVLGGQLDTFSDRTVVPAGKLKGAVRWTYETPYDGTLTADVGYQFTGYYQVVRTPQASQSSFGTIANLGNFGYHGMVFELKWQAAV